MTEYLKTSNFPDNAATSTWGPAFLLDLQLEALFSAGEDSRAVTHFNLSICETVNKHKGKE